MDSTAEIARNRVASEADGSVVVALSTDPRRPPVRLDATIRHPARFRAALGAFLAVVRSGLSIVTVADDAWIMEGFAGDQAAYVQIDCARDEFDSWDDVQVGTSDVLTSLRLPYSLGDVRGGATVRLRLDPGDEADFADARPPGWLRGFSGMMAALSLSMRRVPIDRGGLFALITALGRSRTRRASRSVAVRSTPGRGPEVVVRPGARPVVLHAQERGQESRGSAQIVVGHQLANLSGLLPWVDAADLFLLGPGLPSFWSVKMGGIRILLGVPGWTADGRLGGLSLDPLFPPVGPSRSLMNQVVATFRDHPTQTRAQVVERTQAKPPEVAAVLLLLAARGQVLPDPDPGLFRSRVAVTDPAVIAADEEPVEAVAARSILATTSIQVTRNEVRPDGRGRRVEGTILDRPVTIDLDGDGWMTRGRCTCSHNPGGSLRRRGPCRHQVALQVAASPQSSPTPDDLAAWFASFPAPLDLA